MKKLIFYSSFFLLALVFFSANAQNVAIGIQGGISIPNLTSGGSGATQLSNGYSSRFGPDAELYAEFKLADEFSIQPGIEYSSQGGKKDGFQALPTPSGIAPYFQPAAPPQYLYATYNSTAKLNYLMLPILGKYGWDLKSHLRLYVDFGPFLSYLLSANQVTSGSSELYTTNPPGEPLPVGAHSFDQTTSIKDQLHTFDFGVEGNLGLAYKFKKSYIFIQGGGNYGFFNIQKVAEDGKNETGAATVSLGYSIWIGKPAAESK